MTTDAAPDPGSERTRRVRLTVLVGFLLVLSLVLPNLTIGADVGYGDWLIPAGSYFLNIQVASFGPAASGLLAFACNVAYAGLAAQELGLVLAATTFWVLAAEEVNRWLWRLLVVAGGLLALGGLLPVAARMLIAAAGVDASLGLSFLATLMAAALLLWGARRSKDRIDLSWYPARPELQ